jgi:outer membrane protein assembly factor BamE (lipoprotein component of BamABCDE complex)
MKKILTVLAVVGLAACFPACRTTSSTEKAPEKKPPRQERTEKKAPPPKAAAQSAPAGSPLAKIQNGMRVAQVYDLIGHPTSERVFPSAKAFNPFYYGPDQVRKGLFYKGLGRVVISGAGIVVQVEYDPSEDGY